MSRCRLHEVITLREVKPVGCHDQRAATVANNSEDSWVNPISAVRMRNGNLSPDGLRRLPDVPFIGHCIWIGWINKNSYGRPLGDELIEDLYYF